MQVPPFPNKRGAATPKIVVYLVFTVLIAAIVTFITVGYFTYKEDMKLSTTPVTISMHDPATLKPEIYTAQDSEDKVEKGAILKTVRTAEPTMSGTEKSVWIISGVAGLGVLVGIVLLMMKRRQAGQAVAIGSVIVLILLGCWGWYLNKHRETPYQITMQPDMKNGVIQAPVIFVTNDATSIKIDKKDESALSLKTGIKASITYSDEGDEATKLATKIISPIPDKDPKKGEIIKVELSTTAKAGMSFSEEFMWGIAGLAAFGCAFGVWAKFKKGRKTGLWLIGASGVIVVVCVWQAVSMSTHRVPAYDIVLKPNVKGTQKAEPITLTADGRTTVLIEEKPQEIVTLKPGMKISAVVVEGTTSATSIVSPIPELDPKKGEILRLAPTPGAATVMSIGEKLMYGLGGLAIVVVVIGLVTVFMSGWKMGLSVAGVGAIGLALCGWQAQSLAAQRVPPYEIVIKPEMKNNKQAEPVTITTDSSTTVKIEGEEQDVPALKPGMKITATFTESSKSAATIVSPVLGKRKAALRLPAGFTGSTKRAEPKYLGSVELKEQYLVQSFSVERGSQKLQVAQVDREPLGFAAFARSVRLGAQHDFKSKNILKEGPMMIAGISPVKWAATENPFNREGINAYTLIIEGEDENGVHVKCRQVAIQGEGTTMYVIKGTAPATDWPAAGEIFDSSISTFEIAAVTDTPAAAPAAKEAEKQAAAAATTQAATQATSGPASEPATQPVDAPK